MKLSSRLIVIVGLCLSPLSWGSSHGDSGKGISPESALHELEAGNQRYVSGSPLHRKQGNARRRELATGQAPNAIILSCADSRVPPELIFDQGLGEIFTIRVAGNVLGAATVASIEYAVEHLGSRLLVVMGHESCGAIKAALDTPAHRSAGSLDLDSLVSSIRPNLEGFNRSIASEDKTLREPVKKNVNGVANRLLARSKIVRKHVEEGKLQIVRGIYSLESGKVDFWKN